jgi:hypothetical protein
MSILAIVIFTAIICWVVIDFKKVSKEERRCPKCNQVTKEKFPWKYNNKPIAIPGKDKEKLHVTIYKCLNCGTSWNHTYEYNEDTT